MLGGARLQLAERALCSGGVVARVKLVFVLKWKSAAGKIDVRRQAAILRHAVDGSFIDAIARGDLALAQVAPALPIRVISVQVNLLVREQIRAEVDASGS